MANVDWESHFEDGTVLKTDTPAGEWDSWYDDGSTTDYEATATAALKGNYGLRIFQPNALWSRGHFTNNTDIPNYTDDDEIHVAMYVRFPSTEWEWPDGERTQICRIASVGGYWCAVILSNTAQVMQIWSYAENYRSATGTTTLATDTTYLIEMVIPLTNGGQPKLYLDGDLEATVTARVLNTGDDWDQVRIMDTFDSARTGGVGIYYDAVRVGNDGMIGEYVEAATDNAILFGSNF